jgi:putative FmdB family regulatory protein
MPFYEYECENCKFYVEALQKISDPPLAKCPSCGKNKMKKLISAPVFRLKGGGWYETDFKSDQEKKRNLAVEKEPESAPADKSADAKATDTKADAKPAASESKAESKAAVAKASRSKAVTASKPATASRSKPAPRAKPAAKSKAKPAARRKRR